MPKKSEKRWRVCVIKGNRAQEICVLSAVSAEAAIKRVIAEYEIEPERQSRLVAQPWK
jgi:hypothetical protein